MDQPPLLLFLDLAGTFVFAVNGALVAIRATRLDIVGVVTLGMLTGLGGGTLRDALILRVPSVLRNELYAIPALVAAAITVLVLHLDVYSVWTALGAASVAFLIRILGLRFDLHAPEPPHRHRRVPSD